MVYCYRCMWSTHRAARPTGVCKVHTQQQDQHVSSWQSFSRQDKNCLLYINHCFAWFQTWLWSSGEISNVYFFYGLTFRQFWGLVIYEQVHCRHAYHCKIMEKSCMSRHHKIWKPSIFFSLHSNKSSAYADHFQALTFFSCIPKYVHTSTHTYTYTAPH